MKLFNKINNNTLYRLCIMHCVNFMQPDNWLFVHFLPGEYLELGMDKLKVGTRVSQLYNPDA